MNIPQLLSLFRKLALDLLYPPRCVVCGEPAPSLLCDACIAKMKPITEPICRRCGKPAPKGAADPAPLCPDCRSQHFRFDWCRSAFFFERKEAPVRTVAEAIYAFKHHGKKALAQTLANLMWQRLHQSLSELPIDLLLPVPLHKTKEWERGFNQSELLGKVIAKQLNVPMLKGVLVRIRATKPQFELSIRERMENVRGAFELLKPEAVRGKNVLLLDDIITTGATLNECAKALRKGKPKAIYCVTLSRTAG